MSSTRQLIMDIENEDRTFIAGVGDILDAYIYIIDGGTRISVNELLEIMERVTGGRRC